MKKFTTFAEISKILKIESVSCKTELQNHIYGACHISKLDI